MKNYHQIDFQKKDQHFGFTYNPKILLKKILRLLISMNYTAWFIPYEKRLYDFYPKNIQFNLVQFSYIWPYDKCAKNWNKSYTNCMGKIACF